MVISNIRMFRFTLESFSEMNKRKSINNVLLFNIFTKFRKIYLNK